LVFNYFEMKALELTPLIYPDENKYFTKKYGGGGGAVHVGLHELRISSGPAGVPGLDFETRDAES
jgi:hypothetical protein